MEEYSYIWRAEKDKYVLLDDEFGRSILSINSEGIKFLLIEDDSLTNEIINKMLECGNRRYSSMKDMERFILVTMKQITNWIV